MTDEEQAIFDQLVTSIERKLDPNKVPGAAVAIVLDGKLVLARGIGIKKVGTQDPVTENTLFHAASMSKMVTAATVMSLVDEEKIDVSQPITTYLPDFHLHTPFDASTIKVQHLLTHTSGIQEDTVLKCAVNDSDLADWIDSYDLNLWAPPGAVWNYANMGYVLLSRIAENVAGVPFRKLATERVLRPAGMETATYYPKEAMATGDYATGHQDNGTGVGGVTLYNPTAFDCAGGWGPGGVMASVVDYGHLAETFLADGREMLKPASVKAMESAQVPTGEPDVSYGYGLQVHKNYKGTVSVEHGGDLPGYHIVDVDGPR